MKKSPLSGALIALLPAVALAWPSNWTSPTKPFHVIDNVYYVGTQGISAWIIKTPKGLILLDVGMPDAAPLVEANIQALGFKLSDVKILLNSHAHIDHAGGLAKLKADTGAMLIASAGDRYALEKGVYEGSEAVHDLDFPAVKVDRLIGDGEAVELGGVKLTAVLAPGHTRGCTGYALPVTDHGAAHQAFFFCSASVAANRLAPNPQYPSIVEDYKSTFARLKTIKADVLLAPHAEQFDLVVKRARIDGPANPFVREGELQALTQSMEADFAVQLAKQTKAGTPK